MSIDLAGAFARGASRGGSRPTSAAVHVPMRTISPPRAPSHLQDHHDDHDHDDADSLDEGDFQDRAPALPQMSARASAQPRQTSSSNGIPSPSKSSDSKRQKPPPMLPVKSSTTSGSSSKSGLNNNRLSITASKGSKSSARGPTSSASPSASSSSSLLRHKPGPEDDSSDDERPQPRETLEDLPPYASQMHNSMEAHVKMPNIDWDRFGEVHKLHNEVGDLRALVASKEAELEAVSEALLTLKDELQLIQSQDVHQAAKELARRNKQLSVQLERERTRARQLADEVFNLQAAAGQQATKSDESKEKDRRRGGGKGKDADEEDEEGENSVEALRQQAADLRAKYTLANKRMLDARAQVAQAKQAVARMAKVLQREVGDEVVAHLDLLGADGLGGMGVDALDGSQGGSGGGGGDGSSVLGATTASSALRSSSSSSGAGSQDNSKPGWVGRAQKISLLTAKLKETRALLAQLQIQQQQQQQQGGVVGGSASAQLQHLSHLLSVGALDSLLQGGADAGDERAQSLADILSSLQQTLPLSLSSSSASSPSGVQGPSQGWRGGGASASAAAALAATSSDRQRQALDALERERRAEHERLASEHEVAAKELGAARQKMDALNARCRTLEGEYRTLRGKMKAVLDKSDADDRLIDALKADLEQRKADAKRLQRQGSAASERAEAADQLRAQNQQQGEQLENQKRIILALRDEVSKVRSKVQQAMAQQLEHVSGALGDHEAHMLRVELQKQRDLVEIYRQRLDEAEYRISQASIARIHSESQPKGSKKLAEPAKLAAPKGRASSSSSSSAASSAPSEAELEQLRQRCQSLESGLSSRTDELRICQEMLAQQRSMHQRALSDLRMKVSELEGMMHGLRSDS